jgi:hypothetical protein
MTATREDPMRRSTMTQYNVDFPSDSRKHAALTKTLLREKIDFQSLMTTRIGDRTMVQFLAPKNDALRDRLRKRGIAVREDLIFQVEIPHHHWELHRLAKTLAEKGINIESLYSMVDDTHMRIILAVDQPANAVALMESLGYNPDYSIFE